jgi:hypothetical protein
MMRYVLFAASVGIAAISLMPTTAGATSMKEKPKMAPANTVELLFVETADDIVAADGKLTLKGIGKTVIYFSDRPERLAGHYSVPEFLSFWSNGEGPDSFLKDPPNATLSVFEPGQKDLTEAVVEISHPQVSADDMTYDVKVLSGNLPKSGGAASLFIDIIGMPLTPMSYAGAARRAVRY